jgi:4-amino-4-deoxy-L-arabinose transferase-like glycosyltransferase
MPGRPCRQAAWLWTAVASFVAGTVWWCAHDDRVPDWDSGVHMGFAVIARNELRHGRIAAPWDVYTTYPPLQHLVGAIILLIGGLQPSVLLIGANLVFVPLLAFGCYGTGKALAGPRAGLLAGLVALGTPMFVSEMHMYEPDPEQAAMVAVAVWALLASQHFRRTGVSAVAGVPAGLAVVARFGRATCTRSWLPGRSSPTSG